MAIKKYHVSNAFDKTAVTMGKALNENGQEMNVSTFCVSDYITISAETIKIYNVLTTLEAWRIRVHGYNAQGWVMQLYTENITNTTAKNIEITIPGREKGFFAKLKRMFSKKK